MRAPEQMRGDLGRPAARKAGREAERAAAPAPRSASGSAGAPRRWPARRPRRPARRTVCASTALEVVHQDRRRGRRPPRGCGGQPDAAVADREGGAGRSAHACDAPSPRRPGRSAWSAASTAPSRVGSGGGGGGELACSRRPSAASSSISSRMRVDEPVGQARHGLGRLSPLTAAASSPRRRAGADQEGRGGDVALPDPLRQAVEHKVDHPEQEASCTHDRWSTPQSAISSSEVEAASAKASGSARPTSTPPNESAAAGLPSRTSWISRCGETSA